MSSPKKPHQTPGTAPANRLPQDVRIGLALINQLVKQRAPDDEINGAICATMLATPHFAVNFFLDGLVTIGHLTETEAQACRQVYAEKYPDRPALYSQASGEFPLQVTIALDLVEAKAKTENDPSKIAGAVFGAAQLMPAQQVDTFFNEMEKRGFINQHTGQLLREMYLEKNPGYQSLKLN